MLPTLRLAAAGEMRAADAIERISAEFNLTPEERAEMLPSGRQAKIANRVHWAVTYLVKAGLLHRPKRGYFRITERGRGALAKPPARIDIAYLSQFEGFDTFRTGNGAASSIARAASDPAASEPMAAGLSAACAPQAISRPPQRLAGHDR